MVNVAQVLGPAFSVLLLVLLGMMVFTTYVLARRPLVINLREIYFFHNAAFTRAWHLVIAGMTLFVAARAITEADRLDLLVPPEGIADLFLVLFAFLVLMAFWELIIVFQRYLPRLGWSDSFLEANIDSQIRAAVLRQDDDDGIRFEVSNAESIYVGRPTLGPQVHLSHYRGVVEGMTRYLERRFGQLGDALLFTVGRQTGHNAAKHMLDEGATAHAALDQFLLELKTANVALPAIIDETPRRVRIRFEECAVCSGTTGSHAPRCHYLAGVVRGLFEATHGPLVEAHETECCSKGDRACVVEVTLPKAKA